MSLLLTNIIYTLVFLILTTKELITDRYDHDIDQFMYFGSRILHGELIWTKEFDDKSPVVQYIFSIPAAFKNTGLFVLLTILISLIATYMGYIMLKDILRNSSLEINRKHENSVLYFGSILYLTLLTSIYGSLHHINAISSSFCLITIAITYLNKKRKNYLLINLSAITAAISLSIRPYYLLNLLILPIWQIYRERNIEDKKMLEVKINKKLLYIKSFLNWASLITVYLIIFNASPYIFSANLSDFFYGIKLNSFDYINHNILQRQYINIGRNPILYPILLGMIALPIIRTIFSKIIFNYYQRKENGLNYLFKLDVDIVFFGIINPLLLEFMFFRKHFFGHYFTLFSPYILISIIILIAISARLNKLINNFNIVKNIVKSTSIIILIACLITNQSLPNITSEIFNKKISEKSYKLELIKEFVDEERGKNRKMSFLAPNNNYIHWKLGESRHGFPQKAVFRNLAEGKMDILINNNDRLKYKFLLPKKDELCETLYKNAPDYIITEKNDYSYICLKKRSSNYKLLSSKQKLKENNIFIYKRFK